MRSYLRALMKAGVVEREGTEDGTLGNYVLTAAGQDLLGVAGILASWLTHSPVTPMQLGGAEAKNAIQALVDGWSAGMIRALAARPMSLTELDSIITAVSYPALERRLTAMRLLGMVEATPSAGRSTPYMITPWLRAAVAPLAAATLWEHRHWSALAPPVARLDIEAAFLLALPLLRLPGGASGTCRLAVRIAKLSQTDGLVGVTADVRSGAVVSCVTALEGGAGAWAHGSPAAWISAIVDRDAHRLELGGEANFARGLVEELRRELSLP